MGELGDGRSRSARSTTGAGGDLAATVAWGERRRGERRRGERRQVHGASGDVRRVGRGAAGAWGERRHVYFHPTLRGSMAESRETGLDQFLPTARTWDSGGFLGRENLETSFPLIRCGT